jgi:hypothetical protein
VDQLVSIEFLDPKVDLVFFNTMLKTMIHGPCGLHNLHSPCMKDGMWSKHYLKGLPKLTSMDVDGYLLYKRENNMGCGYETHNLLVDNQ